MALNCSSQYIRPCEKCQHRIQVGMNSTAGLICWHCGCNTGLMLTWSAVKVQHRIYSELAVQFTGQEDRCVVASTGTILLSSCSLPQVHRAPVRHTLPDTKVFSKDLVILNSYSSDYISNSQMHSAKFAALSLVVSASDTDLFQYFLITRKISENILFSKILHLLLVIN